QITARKEPKASRGRAKSKDPIDNDELLRRWTDPEVVLGGTLRGIEATWYGGEAVPYVFPNFGPNSIGAYLGAELRVDAHTTWIEQLIYDWDHVPEIRLDENNFWWKAMRELVAAACEMGRGKFIVGMTDIGGAGDTLSLFRTSGGLCMDLLEHPEQVREMEKRINKFWFEVYDVLEGMTSRVQQGTATWFGAWHPGRTYTLQSDFSCMISPAMFKEFFIPPLREQAKYMDASIYHLDGPGAICHLDAVLELPNIRAVQWIHGAGQGPMMKWVDLLKRIQAAGIGVHLLWIDVDEVEPLMEALVPEQLWFSVGARSPEHGEYLLRRAREITAGKKC
ncbi:MAG: hypothetical protein QGD94_12980, partial [Planctomycetia bacterium]|nr:hypothetical protein [Planctomycetia bacterium]